MSTYYTTMDKVSACDLFDGRLEKMNIDERIVPNDTTESVRCLTDGENCLWVYIDADGFVTDFVRYAGNNPWPILDSVAAEFNTEIVSEYEARYWGFDTQEDWDAWLSEIAREQDDAFHIELLKHLRGEANDIRPGTIGMCMATIAEQLVAEDPEMLLPMNKVKFHKAIKSTYEARHVIRLTDNDNLQAALPRRKMWSPGPLPRDFVIARSQFGEQP